MTSGRMYEKTLDPSNLSIMELYQAIMALAIVISAPPPENKYLDFPMDVLSLEEWDLSRIYP